MGRVHILPGGRAIEIGWVGEQWLLRLANALSVSPANTRVRGKWEGIPLPLQCSNGFPAHIRMPQPDGVGHLM